MYEFQQFNLSALDHLVPPIYVHYFVSFRCQDASKCILALQAGIAQLVSALPFLTGNVAKPGTDSQRSDSLQIVPPSAADMDGMPLLQVDRCRGKIAQMRAATSLRTELVPRPAGEPITYPTPALRFKINVMEDGMVLCVSWHHSIMDGLGCYTMLRYLARTCRDGENPRFDVEPAEAQQTIRKRIGSFKGGRGSTSGSINRQNATRYSSQNNQVSYHYEFCARRVDYLRSVMNSLNQGRVPPTSDDIVTAVIWLCTGQALARSIPAGSTFPDDYSLTRYTDLRGTFRPRLPPGYIGNAVATARCVCETQQLNPGHGLLTIVDGRATPSSETLQLLNRLVQIIQDATELVGAQHMRRIISCMKQSDDREYCVPQEADISVSSLRKLPLYTLDFGPLFGPVVDVEILETTLLRQCIIKPTRHQEPNCVWEVRVTLPVVAMTHLEQNDLMQWLNKTSLSQL